MKASHLKHKEKIDSSNFSQHNRYSSSQSNADACSIYYSVFAGDLSTISSHSTIADYPFGSVSSFMIDHTGQPVVCSAEIAEHTKNAISHKKSSLLLREVKKQHIVERGWRLTLVGDLEKIAEGDDLNRVKNRYYRFYPEAQSYQAVHNFVFLRLNIKLARVIMGFGKIAWIERKAIVKPSPFSEQQEDQIINHMNDDHTDSIYHYLKQLNVTINSTKKTPKIVSINHHGTTINYHKRLYFLPFEKPVATVDEVRREMIKLSKK